MVFSQTAPNIKSPAKPKSLSFPFFSSHQMADDNSSTGDQTLTPPPANYPLSPATVDGGKIEDNDSSRDSKRRKICPKIDDFVPPNRTFSFTFDTKFSACGSDVTPKFGSFQSEKESAAQLTAEDLPCEVATEILGIKEEEEEGGGGGEEQESDVLGVFEVVEGIELNDTQFPDKIGEENLPL